MGKKHKHTPGTWYPVGYWVEVESDDVPDICTCNPADMGEGHLHRSDEEILANVHLIAAAPAMLDALDAARDYIAAASPKGYSAPCLWIIDAAISKAKGGRK
jgi:hypothetical protein